jgi:plasmid stability protein
MASITVRNLDDPLKARLRVRAARNGRSMEEEVREILRTTLAGQKPAGKNLADSIRQRFAPLGGVELSPLPREFLRDPPDFGE